MPVPLPHLPFVPAGAGGRAWLCSSASWGCPSRSDIPSGISKDDCKKLLPGNVPSGVSAMHSGVGHAFWARPDPWVLVQCSCGQCDLLGCHHACPRLADTFSSNKERFPACSLPCCMAKHSPCLSTAHQLLSPAPATDLSPLAESIRVSAGPAGAGEQCQPQNGGVRSQLVLEEGVSLGCSPPVTCEGQCT